MSMGLRLVLGWGVCMASLSLAAADHRIAGSSRDRHEAMGEAFSAEPAEGQKSWWDQSYMTGDWKGARRSLARAGVTFDAAYVADFLGNPVGGKARGFAYAGSFGPSMNINFGKMGATGLEFFISAVWRTGTNLSERKIDNQFTVAQVFGSQTVKLNELYLIESLWDKRFIVKAGRLDPGNDFLSSPLYWHYVNNAFDGNPVGIFFNVPFLAYPNSTWGAFLELKPLKQLSTKWAVYNANSKISENRYHGLNFTFESTDGALWMTQWCWLVNQQKESRGMPGNYQIGAFYLTGSKQTYSGRSQKGDPGVYVMLDQMLYRPQSSAPKRGLTAFLSLLFQPENRNQFPFFTDAGLVFQGPFASRPDDSAALGYAYGHYSDDLSALQRRRGLPVQDAESVVELNYWVRLNKWFYIAPDMQYIMRPKGRDDIPNAFVVGFQLGLDQW